MSGPRSKWDGSLAPVTRRSIKPSTKVRHGLTRIVWELKQRVKPWTKRSREDRKEAKRAPMERMRALGGGGSLPADASVAIYAHYNGHRSISRMVLKQIDMLKQAGFYVIFVSMSEIEDAERRNALLAVADRVYARMSFGRDFGAWRDAWMLHRDEMRAAGEVLLLNDSVLGPIRPMQEVLAGMRSIDGISGLVDSPDNLGHLQSFFLLFRGSVALSVLDGFFGALQLSFRKPEMIERGELGLARALRRSRLPCRVAFPFETAERLGLASQAFVEKLVAAYPLLASDQPLPDPDDVVGWRRLTNTLRSAVWRYALNPTHYYWRVLVEEMGFPFLKTELVIHNPGCIPDVPDWPEVIGPDSPVTLEDIREHLDMVG